MGLIFRRGSPQRPQECSPHEPTTSLGSVLNPQFRELPFTYYASHKRQQQERFHYVLIRGSVEKSNNTMKPSALPEMFTPIRAMNDYGTPRGEPEAYSLGNPSRETSVPPLPQEAVYNLQELTSKLPKCLLVFCRARISSTPTTRGQCHLPLDYRDGV